MWWEEVQAGSGDRDIGHAAQRPYPVCVAVACFSWPLFSFLWQEGRGRQPTALLPQTIAAGISSVHSQPMNTCPG